ncbi:MAG: sigma-70 family RNA polymerase sigma factor [Bacteroidales bacterium]|jgi:RNA polymerase sigma-70 factor (ECF subfamily)|nr:sigma-70 family RNA polymerase sigma factor [Bacteroidales bacterium]
MMFFKHKVSNISDEELLRLFVTTGRTEYFGQLYHRYIPLVYGLSLKYLRHAEKAEDAVMQLYEELSHKIARYEIKQFKTWLYRVAKNHCLQILRREKQEISIDFDVPVMESESFLHLFNENIDEERFQALQGCLKQLPEPQRISVTQFFLEEMSYADIVDVTGYQLKSVKSYIQNGKRNLKICIEKKMAG